jgi:hypothetical protein
VGSKGKFLQCEEHPEPEEDEDKALPKIFCTSALTYADLLGWIAHHQSQQKILLI